MSHSAQLFWHPDVDVTDSTITLKPRVWNLPRDPAIITLARLLQEGLELKSWSENIYNTHGLQALELCEIYLYNWMSIGLIESFYTWNNHTISLRIRGLGAISQKKYPQDKNLYFHSKTCLKHEASGYVLSNPTLKHLWQSSSAVVMQTLLTWMSEMPKMDHLNLLEQDLAQLLYACGFLCEEEENVQRFWNVEDAIFHASSRLGHHAKLIGPAYPFRGKEAAPHKRKDIPQDKKYIPLPQAKEIHTQPLDAFSKRQSSREFKSQKLSLDDLSTWLYHAQRIKRTQDTQELELLWKAYPSGGALHSLECYLYAANIKNLKPGLYYYDAHQHALVLWVLETPTLKRHIANMQVIFGPGSSQGSGYLFFTFRYPKVAWKYAAIAYRIALIEMGGAMQTLSLLGPSLGIGSSIMGLGNSDSFADLLGISEWEEPLIGEMGFGVL